MTEDYILVKTTEQQNLENILYDLANLYRDTEYVKGIQLYRKKGEIEMFLIQFDNSPDFERFSYFTNYLVYPINFLKFKSKVRGYYKTKDVESFAKLKKGNWLMVYVNHKDQEPDNVYITTEENQSFIFDFGGKWKQLDAFGEDFEEYAIDLNDFNHIIDIYPSPKKESIKAQPWWRLW